MHVTVRELQGLGFLAGTREASAVTKTRLHNASLALALEAGSAPVSALVSIPSRADAFIAEVNSYAPWPEESWCINCYGNTTMVRNNFYVAKNEALRRMGDANRRQIGGASRPTNLFTETAANMPAAVAERARELARGEFDTPEQRAAFGGTGGQRSSVSIEAERAEAARVAQERERARLAQVEADRRDAEARARASAEERARMEAAVAASRSQAERDEIARAQQEASASRVQQEAAARARQEAAAQAERSRPAQASQAAAQSRLEADRAAAVERVAAERAARERAAAARRAEEERAAGANRQIAVGLVSSITNAAAAFGSTYAQSQADKAAAKSARRFAVRPTLPSMPSPSAPTAGGMDQTQMVMIGVGVAAVAGVGLVLALRSGGDDEDED